MAVERGLRQFDLPDTAQGRRRLLEWTAKRVDWREPGQAGCQVGDRQSLHSTLRRGWYFGSESSREGLVKQLAKVKRDSPRESRRKGYSAAQQRDHGQAEAERIIEEALQVFGLAADAWSELPKGDWRKGLAAGLIRERALVANSWLAERLNMGATGAVSRTIAEARKATEMDRELRGLVKRLKRNVNSF